jgi:predicted CXXCH cytochrome family protein
MQFNEWFNSGHANALTSLQGSPDAQDACLTCHSTDYSFTEKIIANTEREGTPPDPMTVANAQFGVTCVACHSPHLDTDYMLVAEPVALCTNCHRDTELTASVHHPVQEIAGNTGRYRRTSERD